MTFDEIEADIRFHDIRPEPKPLALGDAVAWMIRENGKASNLSALHRYYEDGRTFCRLAVPPAEQQFPALPSLKVCKRCERMSARALHYAKLAKLATLPRLKESA